MCLQNGTKFNLTSVQTGLIQVIDRLNFEDIADYPYYFLNATVVVRDAIQSDFLSLPVVVISLRADTRAAPSCKANLIHQWNDISIFIYHRFMVRF